MKRWAALLLFVSGCDSPSGVTAEERIECAVDGAAAFARACTVERTRGRDIIFTIRSPNGSFRRLVATRDGRGVMAADGAEGASVKVVGPGLIEVSIGPDRYRLPARVR